MSRILRNEEAGPSDKGKEYLCYFVHRLLEFRCPEVESLASMEGCAKDVTWRLPVGNLRMSPFWYVNLPDEDIAKAISKNCILTKAFVEVWGEGSTWEELVASIKSCDSSIKDPWFGDDIVFRIMVEGFGISLSMEEQLEAITKLNFLPFMGKVNLRRPDVVFRLIFCDCTSNNSLVDGEVPYRIYFGREVSTNDRPVIDSYSLRKRSYIGPTSMDCEMSFLMCNQARVRKSGTVFDPYAGTGSILVAAAVRGAHVVGGDLDMRIIRDGKIGPNGQTLTLHSNFQQYGLPPPLALLRMDAHTSPFRKDLEEFFDAIIGDPPYGVRAGARKSAPAINAANATTGDAAPAANGVDAAVDTPVVSSLANNGVAPYVPLSSLKPYLLGECLRDLLETSAKLLTVGGRLVYFLPCTPETYSEDELPQHPSLQLVANSEQFLTSRYSRRLITMEKVRRYDAEATAAFYAARPDPTMAIDKIRDFVYEQFDPAVEEGQEVKPTITRAKNNQRCRCKAF